MGCHGSRLRLRADTGGLVAPGPAGRDSAQDDAGAARATDAAQTPQAPVSWRHLPRKDQLAILTLARLSEPLVQTSLQAYMFYQLKWFDPALPDDAVSTQAGILHASFMAAQCVTGLLWGRVADSRRAGRKTVLLIGLLGTSASCLGFGFSATFWQALLFRVLGGITNGNIGVMRTMISEIIREKRFQARAFLLLPMTFNIGVIIGPILGGLLSNLADRYPRQLGGVALLVRFPYAAPNVVSAVFLFCAAVAVWLGLEETLDALRDGPPDLGSRVGLALAARFRSRFAGIRYRPVPTADAELTADGVPPFKTPDRRRVVPRLAFRRIFTRNVGLTLFAQFLLTFHIGTFNSVWFVFLSTPVWDPASSKHEIRLPFFFTGGLGLSPQSVGLAMAVLGVIGITMQIFLYPSVSARLGTIGSWRLSLLCFPIAYFLVPYLSVVPSSAPPPLAKAGAAIWLAICGVLLIQVTGRTFALPSQVILINNCSPHPSVLGTVHGLGQSVNSLARTAGPMIGGVVYGFGLRKGVVGLVWWAISAVSVCTCLASLLVREGDGHEIWLGSDEDDDGGGEGESEQGHSHNRPC